MAFNPDEYLSPTPAFNPDAYLSNFNPDEYLSGTPIAKESALVSQIPGAHTILASGVPTPTTDILKGVGEGIANVATGGTTGMLGGSIGMILNPIVEAAKGNIQSYPAFSNAMGEGFQQGMEQGTYQPKTETGKEYTEKYIAPVISNLMPLAGLGHSLSVPRVEVPKEFANIPRDYPVPKEVAKPFNERALAEQGLQTMDRNIASAAEQLTELHKTYMERGLEVDAENSPLIALRQRLDQMKQDRDALSDRLTGDITDRVQTEQNIKDRKVVDAAEQSVLEATQEAPVEQKTSPHEVALEKVGEAMQDSPEASGERIWAVEEKIKNTPDTPENSALREALEFERASYEKLANGEKLTEEWFNKKPEEVIPDIVDRRVPTSEEVIRLVSDHDNLGSVLETLKKEKVGTMGQRVLVEILSRIPHVLSSKF